MRDPKHAADHPARVIGGRTAAMRNDAIRLHEYERAHGVTFVAVDNTALDALARAYARVQDAQAGAVDDLMTAIRDLFDMDDD
jgi:hypothetical protein